MPPNKSRRLPGGRVRRPGQRPDRPVRPDQDSAGAVPPEERPDSALDVEAIDDPASLGSYRVGPSAGRSTDAVSVTSDPESIAPAPGPMTSRQRLRERAARRGVAQRTGPSSMDLVAQHYQHIRVDLLKILILSAIMFGIIVVLALVLR
ncbi:MAG TPA: hypothetical protein VGW38_02915 [Chloroflexota bacterium]|nr:hypothetical protein [Chloroflexota bacterium]